QAAYGDGSLWTKIKQANPGVDPNDLKVGQVIKIPPK
ncbi:MAG: LysM peptidoglycan-binding domain-containing protein, partial [Phycisphaerae bacterium]|nr:LysM peptidoglycan-binding domain-containing protein [Phycisphaerae bacterium]